MHYSTKGNKRIWYDCKSVILDKSLFLHVIDSKGELCKPLIKLLRIVDDDLRPLIGFIYDELKDVKKEVIRICKGVKKIYNLIMYIIDSRIKNRFDSPLDLIGHILNPY